MVEYRPTTSEESSQEENIEFSKLEKKSKKGCIGCLGFTALIAILSAVLIPTFDDYSTKSKTNFIKNTIINIFDECTSRSKEGLSTRFLDINSLIDGSVGAIQAPDFQIEVFGADTCFNIIAYPPDEDANEITWFSIKLDPETRLIKRNCGDPSKFGCDEGNTW